MAKGKRIMETTPLCDITYKYGSDKCPQLCHSYTPIYYEIFKDRRESVKKVLELGIGAWKNMGDATTVYDKGLDRYYHKGASLLTWREFFPNAQIYGADIVPEAMMVADRIQTFIVDERFPEQLANLIKQTGSDIDFFIDDGAHTKWAQINACRWIKPLLKKDVVYVIEDVKYPDTVISALDHEGYNCQAFNSRATKPRSKRDNLIIVTDK
jgi:hypothetical protein